MRGLCLCGFIWQSLVPVGNTKIDSEIKVDGKTTSYINLIS